MVNQGIIAIVYQVKKYFAFRRIARIVGQRREDELRKVVVFELVGLFEAVSLYLGIVVM
jgi:hypothetical protein